jgi:DNA-binding transcriptional LysR family regulator
MEAVMTERVFLAVPPGHPISNHSVSNHSGSNHSISGIHGHRNPSGQNYFSKPANVDGNDRATLDITAIADEQFILLHPDKRLRQLTNSIFAKAGIKPRILLETGSIETALRLSAAGMAFTFVPEASALYTGLLREPEYYLVGDPPLTWTLGLFYRDRAYITKAARAFADVTREVIHTLFSV